MGCLMAQPGTCCNAVWMDVGIPGTVPDWLVTKAYGLVGETPRLMPQPWALISSHTARNE